MSDADNLQRVSIIIFNRFLQSRKGERTIKAVYCVARKFFTHFIYLIKWVKTSWTDSTGRGARRISSCVAGVEYILSEPEVTAYIYCKSRNLHNTYTKNYSIDLR